ncbi:hypothetical protein JBL43_16480 [Aureibaculum sp. A20]|uniref:Uncharacterized protein n=1 Tax=Aureibaculum flavum TaxID=2795986 RepID=A0ABS0WV61_9FLAO|nr:hypothetical protein [Aureibaculum flavum]MBJ2175852.1 hypothetical protein [Aureibaculum flavum]
MKKTYYFICLIFAINVILNYFSDWQLYGYLTEKIIAWVWILCTTIYIITFWKNKSARNYFYVIIALLVLSIIPMAIPFFGMYNYITTNGDYQQIQLNKDIRIEVTRHNALSTPRVFIFERQYEVLEHNICRPAYSTIFEEVTDYKEAPRKHSLYDKINTINAVLITKNNDSIGIEYEILNKKKIIYHKLNIGDGY